MNILLIATNRQDRFMNRLLVRPLPLGVAYVASHLDPERHRLQVLDLMFAADPLDAVARAIEAQPPELIGLSLRNLDNQSALQPQSQLPFVKALVARLRQLTSATIVCGGPAFSLLPAACLDYLQADLGLAGDADETFAELADRLAEGADYRHLPGLVFRDGPRIVVRPGRAASAFRRPPRLDLLDVERYRRAGFGVGVVTKLSSAPDAGGHGAAWRLRPVADILRELRTLSQRFGLRRVFFVDAGFNLPLAHGKELCRALGEARLGMRWNTYLRPGPCDEELLALMRQHGCTLALVAGAPPADAGAALDHTLRELDELCRACEAQRLPYALALTFGEPGDTRDTVEAKLAFLKARRPSLATLRFGLRILPGTAAARMALQEGQIRAEAELLEPIFYVAAAVRPWLLERLRAEAAQRPRWHVM